MGTIYSSSLTAGEIHYLFDAERRVKAILAAIEAAERNPRPRLVTFGWPVGQRVSEYWGTYMNMMMNEWRDGEKTLTTPDLVRMGELVLARVGTWEEWERRLWWIALNRKTWREVKVEFRGQYALKYLRRHYDYLLAQVIQDLERRT